MKSKPIDGKAALDEFRRTMKGLFRVPKSAVQEITRKTTMQKKTLKLHA